MKILKNIILTICFIIGESIISAAPTNNNNCVCGGEVIKSRIKNGHKVKSNKYPWMVQIKSFNDRDEDQYFQCGGSLIDNQHIITAAHCFENEDGSFIEPDNVEITMGTIKFDSSEAETYMVDKIWIDPNYDPDSLANDFAIIKLNEKVEFNRKISPICLPATEIEFEQFTIAGWGRKGSGKHDQTSNRLLDAIVNFVPRDQCKQLLLNWLNKTNADELKSPDFNVNDLIADTHLCAINKATGSDACAGDSGGPLMYFGQNGRWFLAGVVSGSWEECGIDEDGASLYTKLSYYREIIEAEAPSACWRDP